MNIESSDLKPMGTQSKESMDVEAAQAARRGPSESAAAPARNAATSKDGGPDESATKSTINQALAALQAARQQMRQSAINASELAQSYTKEEPFKALLVAAATGALLMGVALRISRSER